MHRRRQREWYRESALLCLADLEVEDEKDMLEAVVSPSKTSPSLLIEAWCGSVYKRERAGLRKEGGGETGRLLDRCSLVHFLDSDDDDPRDRWLSRVRARLPPPACDYTLRLSLGYFLLSLLFTSPWRLLCSVSVVLVLTRVSTQRLIKGVLLSAQPPPPVSCIMRE